MLALLQFEVRSVAGGMHLGLGVLIRVSYNIWLTSFAENAQSYEALIRSLSLKVRLLIERSRSRRCMPYNRRQQKRIIRKYVQIDLWYVAASLSRVFLVLLSSCSCTSIRLRIYTLTSCWDGNAVSRDVMPAGGEAEVDEGGDSSTDEEEEEEEAGEAPGDAMPASLLASDGAGVTGGVSIAGMGWSLKQADS